MPNPVIARDWNKGDCIDRTRSNTMTARGAAIKTMALLGILMFTLYIVWSSEGILFGLSTQTLMIASGIAGLVVVLIASFAISLSPILAPLYAAIKGVFLGALTYYVEKMYPGLPSLAAIFTLGTLGGMLLLYTTGILRASPKFIKGVGAATLGLCLGMLLLWVLSMFGIGFVQDIRGALFGNGMIGIGFSIVCIVLAALNLVIDFHHIEQGERSGAKKQYEWFLAMGLLVTLVWLYVEILRLLMKLQSRD